MAARRIGDRIGDGLARAPEFFAETRLGGGDFGGQRIRRFVGGRLRIGIGDDGRPAIGNVDRRKAGGEGGRTDAAIAAHLAFDLCQMRIEMRGRFDQRALRSERDQIVELAHRFGLARQAGKERIEMRGGARAGFGHVDMRIGPVADQRIGFGHHLRRHIGVKIEAGDQRNVGADGGADARQQFALAVVEMFGDHGAVKIEIDGIEGCRAVERVEHHRGDALEGIFGHMRGRRRRTPDQRQKRVAGFRCGVDETGDGHVHAAEAGQQRRPALQFGP